MWLLFKENNALEHSCAYRCALHVLMLRDFFCISCCVGVWKRVRGEERVDTKEIGFESDFGKLVGARPPVKPLKQLKLERKLFVERH